MSVVYNSSCCKHKNLFSFHIYIYICYVVTWLLFYLLKFLRFDSLWCYRLLIYLCIRLGTLVTALLISQLSQLKKGMYIQQFHYEFIFDLYKKVCGIFSILYSTLFFHFIFCRFLSYSLTFQICLIVIPMKCGKIAQFEIYYVFGLLITMTLAFAMKGKYY